MADLTRMILAKKAGEGALAIYCLAKAGFVFKTNSAKIASSILTSQMSSNA
jgi:hypothetical protein